jgi:hypothetical protein
LDNCYSWLEQRARWMNRSPLVAAVIIAVSMVTSFPSLSDLIAPYRSWPDAARAWKIQHPFSVIPVDQFVQPGPDRAGSYTHLRKCTYRITLPVIAHLARLGLRGADFLDLIGSIGFLVLLSLIFQRITRDPLIGFLFSLSAACAYLGQWGLHNLSFSDGFAYFLLAIAAFSRQPAAIAVALVLCGFSDERGILAAPLIYLLHANYWNSVPDVMDLLRPNRRQRGVIAGCLVFLALRVSFGFYLGKAMDTADLGTAILHYNFALLPLGAVIVYKGAAVILVTGMLAFLRRQSWQFGVCVCLAAVPTMLASVLVWDLCRSLGYTFPLLLICAKALMDSGDEVTVKARGAPQRRDFRSAPDV